MGWAFFRQTCCFLTQWGLTGRKFHKRRQNQQSSKNESLKSENILSGSSSCINLKSQKQQIKNKDSFSENNLDYSFKSEFEFLQNEQNKQLEQHVPNSQKESESQMNENLIGLKNLIESFEQESPQSNQNHENLADLRENGVTISADKLEDADIKR